MRLLPDTTFTALAAAGTDVAAICKVIADAFCSTSPSDVHAWVLEIGGDELRSAGHAVPPGSAADAPVASVAVIGDLVTVLGGGTPVLLRGLDRSSRTDDAGPSLTEQADALVGGSDWGEMVLVPLAVDGEVTGLLAVSRPASAPFRPDEVALAGRLGAAVALRVDHARLVTGARRYARQQQALSLIGEFALRCPPHEELMELVVREIAAGLNADIVDIFALNADGATATMLAATGGGPGPGECIPLSPSALDRARRADTSIRMVHVGQADYGRSTAATIGMASTISVQLLQLGGTPTFLGAGRRARRPFALRDQRFFASAAHLLAAGIELRTRQDRLARQAHTDDLTGLWNRAHLLSELDELSRRDGPSQPIALLLADLDEFKVVNDTIGHEAGDRLLRTVGARLASVVRPGDIVVRMGGDEFAVLCVGVDERATVAIAERVLATVSTPVTLEGWPVHPGASIGVALASATTGEAAAVLDTRQLLVQADLAMYRAKGDGGRRVVVYDEVLHEEVERRAALEHGLRRALRQNDLSVAFQPIVYLADGTMRAAEALVRWHDPELGWVPPTDLIAAAERSSLVCDVDAWVLAEAARHIASWIADGLTPIRVSVNFSARNFADVDFVDRVCSILADAKCPPAMIVAEITETHLLTDAASHVIPRLRAHGVEVAIDDYGVGYSSVARLTRLPFGLLKIDRTFVAGMLDDPNEAAVVRSTIALGHELNKVVVAEGVEQAAQLHALARLGCDAVQGYLLARPAPGAQLRDWIVSGLPIATTVLTPPASAS